MARKKLKAETDVNGRGNYGGKQPQDCDKWRLQIMAGDNWKTVKEATFITK